MLDDAARPSDFHDIGDGSVSESKMDAHVAMRRVCPTAPHLGGLRLAALAQAFHIPIAPHGAQYPDLNCHLMAAVPNGLIVSSCPPSENEQIWSALYAPAFQVENGRIAMSERPGLGLQLNPDFVERHKV